MKRTVLLFTLVFAACADPSATDLEGGLPADEASIAAGPALVWPVVRRGDSNRDVTTVQYLLRHRGQAVTLSGSFDASTESAIRAVQQARGLMVDGVVGEQTWRALVAEVRAGDSGPAVGAAQYLLRERHGRNLDVTSQFGPTTRAVVEAFQGDVCLGVTGVVGLYTWNALIASRSFCDGEPEGTAAQRILAYHRAGAIQLWDQTFGRFDQADPLSNVTAAASGRAARTSCYGGAPCTTVRLSSGLLTGMVLLHERHGFDYVVTSIAGASHSPASYHYVGRAVDVGAIDASASAATPRGRVRS
jgi:hypothetical protein